MTAATTAAVAPRPSATVMLIRDGTAGLEVFMVTRDRQVDFASGAIVFPGGKVDADDGHAGWAGAAGGTARTPALAYWIAAIRETFEEAGILIARAHGGADVVDGAAAARIAASHRGPLLDGARPFSEIAQREALAPALDLMLPFAHWITPAYAPRRFDTHFFLVRAPAGQHAEHDGREAVRSLWTTPAALFAEADAGRQVLVPATRLNLELLAENSTVAAAMAATRVRKIVSVMPAAVRIAGGIRITIPADAGYRTTEVFIAGPAGGKP